MNFKFPLRFITFWNSAAVHCGKHKAKEPKDKWLLLLLLLFSFL